MAFKTRTLKDQFVDVNKMFLNPVFCILPVSRLISHFPLSDSDTI